MPAKRIRKGQAAPGWSHVSLCGSAYAALAKAREGTRWEKEKGGMVQMQFAAAAFGWFCSMSLQERLRLVHDRKR
jgi:hypothetical protein